MMNDLEALRTGLEIRHPREPAERRQNANIAEIQARLVADEITLYEFLEVAPNYFEPGPAIDDDDQRDSKESEDSDNDLDGAGPPHRGRGRGRGRRNQRGAHPRLRYNNGGRGRRRGARDANNN